MNDSAADRKVSTSQAATAVRTGAARASGRAVIPETGGDTALGDVSGTSSASPERSEQLALPNAEARERANSISARLKPRSPGLARQIDSLARVTYGDEVTSEILSWSGIDILQAFDPAAVVTRAVLPQPRASRIAYWTGFVRNFLVFGPVLVTWLGLGIATAAYATCELAGQAKESPSFLYLWQQGFIARGVTCPGAPTGLLSNFSEVVSADVVMLVLIIGLTIVSQVFASRAEAAVRVSSREFADDLRVFLVEVARRLHLIRAAQDANATGTLFIGAFSSLEKVASEFASKADEMIAVLDARSRDAESHLAKLSDMYRGIADDSKTATVTLSRVLESTAQSTDELSAGVVRASAQFSALGGQLEGAATELRRVTKAVDDLRAVDESSQKRFDETAANTGEIAKKVTALASIDQEIRQIATVNDRVDGLSGNLRRVETSLTELVVLNKGAQGQLSDTTANLGKVDTGLTRLVGISESEQKELVETSTNLRRVEGVLNRLLALEQSAQKQFDDTAANTHATAESVAALTNIDQSIRDLTTEIRRARTGGDVERVVLPRLGWQYGVGALGLLAAFQLLTVAVVWGDRAANATREAATAPIASSVPERTPGLFELPTPPALTTPASATRAPAEAPSELTDQPNPGWRGPW